MGRWRRADLRPLVVTRSAGQASGPHGHVCFADFPMPILEAGLGFQRDSRAFQLERQM